MGRESVFQPSFDAGELSPLMLGRADLDKRSSGLFTCLNAVPLVQGGWTRRPGTLFLKEAKFSDKATGLFPFQFSIVQTYQLEFGDLYIRFYTSHGILTATSQALTAATKANPCVVTYTGADTYANGDRVYVTGVVGMTQLNNREFIVANVNAGANTFELQEYLSGVATNVNSTNYDTLTGSGAIAEIFQVTTTYTAAQIAAIRIVQSADVLYILHPDHPPRKLVRVSALSWTLSDLSLTDGPYDIMNTTATTLTPSAATGAGVTLTASAITGINNNTGFQATDVGRLIRLQEGSTWGYVIITAWTNTTVVTVTVLSTLTNTNAKLNWRMSIWSGTTGYPRCGTFFEDRLFLAGAASYPQRLDGSMTGQYENFSPSSVGGTVADNNAVAFTLNSNDVNTIRWLADNEKGLLAGTARGEWHVRASSLGEALTPTNIMGKPSTKHGSASVAPVQADNVVLYVQRAGKKLRELAYVFEADGFKSPDMTILAEHVMRPSVTQLAYAEEPQAVVWGVRTDGSLLGFTYERSQKVVGWHRHELGGQSDSGGLLIPVVESVSVTPAPDTTRDELYLIARRYINGHSRRFVELMTKYWETEDSQEDAFHLDCGWTVVNSPAATTVMGLWFLEGETVSIYADGAKVAAQVVTNGKVTLATAASVITLGYSYNSDAVTMPPEGGSQDGSSQTKTKKISRVGFWLLDTLGLKYGPDFDHMFEIVNRTWGAAANEPTPLFTGVYRDRFEGDYDRLAQVYWRCDGPFPATVLALAIQLDTADGS